MNYDNIDAPLVSVYMITYNHEQYIERAFVSVLMQKTSFIHITRHKTRLKEIFCN